MAHRTAAAHLLDMAVCSKPGCTRTLGPRNIRGICRLCLPKDPAFKRRVAAVGSAWYLENQARSYNRHLIRKYGITLEGAEALRVAQGGRCAVCLRAIGELGRGVRDAHLDHCHQSGRVRGVLCPQCNKALGLFGDHAPTVRAAANYLESHKCQ